MDRAHFEARKENIFAQGTSAEVKFYINWQFESIDSGNLKKLSRVQNIFAQVWQTHEDKAIAARALCLKVESESAKTRPQASLFHDVAKRKFVWQQKNVLLFIFLN